MRDQTRIIKPVMPDPHDNHPALISMIKTLSEFNISPLSNVAGWERVVALADEIKSYAKSIDTSVLGDFDARNLFASEYRETGGINTEAYLGTGNFIRLLRVSQSVWTQLDLIVGACLPEKSDYPKVTREEAETALKEQLFLFKSEFHIPLLLSWMERWKATNFVNKVVPSDIHNSDTNNGEERMVIAARSSKTREKLGKITRWVVSKSWLIAAAATTASGFYLNRDIAIPKDAYALLHQVLMIAPFAAISYFCVRQHNIIRHRETYRDDRIAAKNDYIDLTHADVSEESKKLAFVHLCTMLFSNKETGYIKEEDANHIIKAVQDIAKIVKP